MNPKIPERIPVILLSGFLGSGKTTLLNSLLKERPRSAVIINEFGATPIDQQLLRDHHIRLSVLSGGCLCCQVRDALIPVLKNLRMAWENVKTADTPFDRIIIEASGVANPETILDILLRHHWLSTRINLQAMIATVSAVMDEQHFDDFPEVQAQIAWADTIVITQTDLASDSQMEKLHLRLDQLAPAATRLIAVQGVIDVDNLLSSSRRFRRLNTDDASAELSEHSFSSISLRLEHPMPWDYLQNALNTVTTRYGEQLIRLKGIVYTPEDIEPLLVQGVAGRLYPPARLAPRASDDGIGRLVLISHGEIKNLTEDLLAELDH